MFKKLFDDRVWYFTGLILATSSAAYLGWYIGGFFFGQSN